MTLPFSSPVSEGVEGPPRNVGRIPKDAARPSNFSRPSDIGRHLRLVIAATVVAGTSGCAGQPTPEQGDVILLVSMLVLLCCVAILWRLRDRD